MLDIMQIIFKIKSIKQIELLPFPTFFFYFLKHKNDFLIQKINTINQKKEKYLKKKTGFPSKLKFNRVISNNLI
jgi:hypothetical protein